MKRKYVLGDFIEPLSQPTLKQPYQDLLLDSKDNNVFV